MTPQQIAKTIQDLEIHLGPKRARLKADEQELEHELAMQYPDEFRIVAARRVVAQTRAVIEPYEVRIAELKSQLPTEEQRSAARANEATKLQALDELMRRYNSQFGDFLTVLERAYDAAEQLNKMRNERLVLTQEIQQLRDDNLLEGRISPSPPDPPDASLAFRLALYVQESVNGLPSDTLENELASERAKTA